ncbi:hypothetical protein L5M38_20465 [Shewanella sp. SM101]|uniref:hypothetical protein n=1 Tax=Shewanella TaxID=22 RepID=UPI0021DAB12F|nr:MULTISPECIES: hypothetical protein [unclassified Shewanella]MCU8008945.1 hypothetical protein [Shewanella sp. SM87]MCU8106896.1 hypothetical protein [Shewanella sp. SM101]
MSKKMQALDIVNRMKQSYDCLLFLGGEEKLVESVRGWRGHFVTIMKEEGKTLIESLIVLLERAKGHKDEGMLMLILLAVAFELAEETLIQGTELCLPKQLSTDKIGQLAQLLKCMKNS